MSSTQTQRAFIAEMEPNVRFSSTFCIGNAQLAVTRNGDPYLACLLSDKSGQVPGRKWQMDAEEFKTLPVDGFVFAEGRTQPFKGELQLIIDRIEAVDAGQVDLGELLPCTSKNIDDMFAQVVGLLGSIEHTAMRALVKAYLEDENLMTQFRQAPAAKMMHHAYIGGLLEHTLSLMTGAEALLPNYPALNRDLVLIGLFLHDLGKTRELAWDGAFSYTDRGELVGHIVEGAIMLHDKAQQVMTGEGIRFPPNAITVLQHIVLSHHGIPEYGAAKIPATPEAQFVSMLDNLDAKVDMAVRAARPQGKSADLGGNFTEKQWALSTKLFKPDVLKK